MPWLALIPILLAFAASFAAGLWLGARGRRRATIAAAGLLAVVLACAALHYFPRLEFPLADFDGYVAVRPFWKYPFALAILGVGTMQATAAWRRVIVESVAGFLFLLVGTNLHDVLREAPPRLYGVPDADGVCLQTSGYSCGAAAASTLLARVGVASDEREMAVLCRTTPWMGTDEFYACRGLREKLAGTGLRPRLVAAGWEELRRGPLPAMAVVRWSFLIDHWVVVLAAREDGVTLADPLHGVVTWDKERFLGDWRNELVRVEAEPETASPRPGRRRDIE